MGRILWMIIVVLIVIWVLGLVLKIGGGLIHLILLIAGIVLIVQLISGKRKL
ncbi:MULTISPECIES: lmo0937 family membrane protein [Paenisporosarcina]|uniref:Lmo0937 family membrane protein n=1 Tax=Paenisporosarcina antarctica TaxID=417367 RepID=A0A4P6ZUY1_9BACL|nr:MULTISPECIES: lmo0937 family membrane protein [Paenisporosarcina]QBP40003.1 lmo0937 family membrane protein [Paenisporosarcina antarctica]